MRLDITERKQLKKAIRNNEARLRDCIETIPEGLVLFDADERLVVCNVNYAKNLGLAVDKIKIGEKFDPRELFHSLPNGGSRN